MKTSKNLLVVVFALPLLVANGANGTWVAREGVGTGGTNWAEWNDVDNWEGKTVASGTDAVATLTPAAGKYISLPSSLSLKYIENGTASSPVVLVGDGSYDLNPSSSSEGTRNCYLYFPFSYSIGGGSSSQQTHGFRTGTQICGSVVSQTSGGEPYFSGTVSFRFDLYATAAGETREFYAFPNKSINMDTGTLRFIAPHGSSTNLTSRWVQTAGSTFLKQADGETPHTLSAGTIVTGDGIPADTFLKRVFPDGSIELSAAPTTTAAANALTFAAFNANTYAKLQTRVAWYYGWGQRAIVVQKYRAEDDFIVKIPLLQGLGAAQSGTNRRYFRIKTEDGFLPGKIELGYIHSVNNPVVYLENCHLEIYQDTSMTGGVAIRLDGTAHTARVTVADGASHSFGRLASLKGKLVKDGAGTLEMSVTNNTATAITGSIVVEEGTFAPKFMDVGTNEIASLTVKSGARLVVPKGVVLKPTSFVVEEGAIFGGGGRIVCPELSEATAMSLVLEDSFSICDVLTESEPFSVDAFAGKPEMAILDGDRILVFGTNSKIRVNGTGSLDVLVVGGGGGGGAYGGGGGGGGGVVYTKSFEVAAGWYNITVGEGGAGGTTASKKGANGADSAAFGFLALGGGGGGTKTAGLSGASGGGAGAYSYLSAGTLYGGESKGDQGFKGGKSVTSGTTHWYSCGGGGGGAGEQGGDAAEDSPGKGGDGVQCNIYGLKYYGSGGGGGNGLNGKGYVAAGGAECGGAGGGNQSAKAQNGVNGTDLRGGGGGGGGRYVQDYGSGGNGGSGVVILRWHQTAPEEGDVPVQDVAVGGTVRHRNGYAIHTFADDGTFVLSEPTIVDILIVGGGGGGGSFSGGGGGGGGVVVVSNIYLSAGSYPISVGLGGAGAVGASVGTGGGDSAFSFRGLYELKAKGGGFGGTRDRVANSGGSGGGGGAPYVVSAATEYLGGAGTIGQGCAGGMGVHTKDAWKTAQGGGGGGAGASGGDAFENGSDGGTPGNGGDGIFCDFSGMPVCYGGGGGGGSSSYTSTAEHYKAAGGLGGGGRGGSTYYVDPTVYVTPGEDGTDGLGGGGGGSGGASDSSSTGGDGGDGVVIVRYRIRKQGVILIVE